MSVRIRSSLLITLKMSVIATAFRKLLIPNGWLSSIFTQDSALQERHCTAACSYRFIWLLLHVVPPRSSLTPLRGSNCNVLVPLRGLPHVAPLRLSGPTAMFSFRFASRRCFAGPKLSRPLQLSVHSALLRLAGLVTFVPFYYFM